MNSNLLDLFELGGHKNYEFHYKITEEKSNELSIDEEKRIIYVTIGNPESDELEMLISDVIKKLK